MGTHKTSQAESLETLNPKQIDVLGGLVADRVFVLCIQPLGVVATEAERGLWCDTFRGALYHLVEARQPITLDNLFALLLQDPKPTSGAALLGALVNQ